MAGTEEVSRMVARLVGDNSSYKKAMKEAHEVTNTFVQDINGRFHTASGRYVSDQEIMRKYTELSSIAIKELGGNLKVLGMVSRGVGASLSSIGKKAALVGTAFSIGVTAPILLFGKSAISSLTKFDQAMTESLSIMSITEEQTARMREQALTLSGQGAQGPEALARSYFFLASAGKDAEQSMSLLPHIAKFATAGAFDMALATDLLLDSQSALGMSSKDVVKDTANLIRLSDVLVKANILSTGSVQQFSEALTNDAATSLRAFNKDAEEGVAVLAAYADQGIKGNVAGSSLSRVMLLLSQSSRKSAEEHAKLGFSVYDSSGKMRNFADIIQNLEQVTKGMSDEVKAATLEQLGFEARVQQAILPLMGVSDKIRNYEAALRDAGGITEEIADKQMKSLQNQLLMLWNRFEVVKISIGEQLVPILGTLMDSLDAALIEWKNLDQGTKDWIVNAAIVVATVGPILIMFGSLTTALGSIATGFGYALTMVANFTIGLKAMVATLGLTGAGLAVLAAGAVIFASWQIYTAQIDEFNDALKETQRLQTELEGRQKGANSKELAGLSGIADNGEKRSATESALAKAQKEVAGYESSLKGATEQYNQLNTVTKRWTGNKMLAAAKQEMEEVKKSHEIAKDRVKNLQDLLKEIPADAAKAEQEVANALTKSGKVGPTDDDKKEIEKKIAEYKKEAELSASTGGGKVTEVMKDAYDLEKKGALPEQIAQIKQYAKQKEELEKQNDLKERAAEITKEQLTAQQKFNATEKELKELLDKKLISGETYKSGVKEAQEALDKATKDKKVKVKIKVEGVEGIEAASAEAAARMSRQAALMNPGLSTAESNLAKAAGAAAPGASNLAATGGASGLGSGTLTATAATSGKAKYKNEASDMAVTNFLLGELVRLTGVQVSKPSLEFAEAGL